MKIANKTTGRTQEVTNEQWEMIQRNPMTASLYEIVVIKTPVELIQQVEKEEIAEEEVSEQ